MYNNSMSVAPANMDISELKPQLSLIRQFLNSHSDIQPIRQAVLSLRKQLPALGVSACAVVIFEKQIGYNGKDYDMPSRAELIMWYENGIQLDDSISTSVTFNPQDNLIPKGVFKEEHDLEWRALTHGHSVFGYMLYEGGHMHPLVEELLFTIVGRSLDQSILYTATAAMTKQQRYMLHTLEETNSELTDMSYKDELTGLLNRRGVLTLGQESINLALEMERTGMVVFADMDGLKAINDTYGHEAGDDAIKGMAKLLRSVFRDNDLIGRMGGDEFVIVATGLTDELIPRVRERLSAAEEKWHEEHDCPYRLKISMGYEPFNEKAFSIEDLLVESDKAMYEEKVQHHTRSARKEIIQ